MLRCLLNTNPLTCRKLQAWNGLNLAIIEANKLAEPDDPDSFRDLIRLQTIMPVYDLVTTLRVRRLAWVGHILRKEESAWTRQVLLLFNEIYPSGYPEGSLLMDAPRHDNVSELIELAGKHGDHTEWNLIVRELEQRLTRPGEILGRALSPSMGA